ncbi:MFS transporter [Pelagicoccus sp. SDUM812003]|uniref:MFS transporter n=1 Tax=Pelagicoccus sp. SDUM812003 TaxID=3041267 RepID=UPI00280F7186|nr:MFS transporter [Pelagicoccus sp. SDUM812003]MDQ8205240.1 MFS transporter [Pelagicoccus sp. SDUM812003]
MSSPAPLKLKEKLGYGLGDTASNFFYQTFNIFLLYYYTDVFGISATAVGTMFLVTKFWDAANDPIMGIIADRTKSRWGSFRPYILWMAVPYGFLGYLMFMSPELSQNGKLIYAWVTYTLMMTAYTAINVPYSALLGVISPSSPERTTTSSYRFVCAFGGGFLISLCVRPLVRYFGAENEAAGFATTMAIFAALSVALFWFTFATTKERVTKDPSASGRVTEDLLDLIKNKPWLILVFGGVFNLSNVAIKNAVTVHYFKYYVGDDNSPFIFFVDRTSLLMSSSMIALIIGVAFAKPLANRFDRRLLMIVLSTINAALMMVFFFVPPEAYWTMFVINFASALAAGPGVAYLWSMYADVADYGEWRFGRRATGLIFSAVLFAQKMGLTIGSGLSGLMLGQFGFVPNVDQTETALLGIRLMFTFIPGVFALLNVGAFILYPLTDAKVEEIEADLAARKAA